MCKYELWVNLDGGGGQTDRQTHRHLNTMTQPGLEAGPSEEENKKKMPSSLG